MDFGSLANLNGFVGIADHIAPVVSALPRGSVNYGVAVGSEDPISLAAASEGKGSKSISLTDPPLQLGTFGTVLQRSSNRSFLTDDDVGTTVLSFSSTSSSPVTDVDNPHCRSMPEMAPLFYQPRGNYKVGMQMQGPFTRSTGPFTPFQWQELELQALTYKYIVANVPVPSHLLIQIRNSLNPFAYTWSSSGSYAPNTIGWGTFHLGLSGSNDPEPGRCRRTDGKKWRCSREAVPDQKYCERHINRGRHRSRKPVEGQSGQVVTGITNTKVAPIASSPSASVISSNDACKSLGVMQPQCKSLQPTAASAVVNRMQGTQGQSIISPTMNFKSTDTPLSVPTHVPIKGPSQKEFGVVCSTSLLCSSDKSSHIYPHNSDLFWRFNDQEAHHQKPIYHFMDDWPKNQSDHPIVSWPEEFKSDRTQLSMSIPITPSDFSSCSSSPLQEKFTITPLSLPHELDMSLWMRNDFSQKQTNWKEVTLGNSIGGPLGEALNSSIPSSAETSRSSAVLNLMTQGWESHSHQGLESSPTGVLQKATFVSFSNSSAGSSPRGGNRASGSVPDDVPCSSLAHPGSIPFL